MTLGVGCSECEHGEVFVYYKDEDRQNVRCDFYYCRRCYPERTDTVSARPGEEVIAAKEFTDLLNRGWNNDDI